jgi:hypothetical protein
MLLGDQPQGNNSASLRTPAADVEAAFLPLHRGVQPVKICDGFVVRFALQDGDRATNVPDKINSETSNEREDHDTFKGCSSAPGPIVTKNACPLIGSDEMLTSAQRLRPRSRFIPLNRLPFALIRLLHLGTIQYD